MDELFTKAWNNKYTRWRIILIISSAALSALFAKITQNILLTIGFVIATAVIDLLVELNDYIKFDFFLKQLFCMKRKYRYLLFITFAILPALCGVLVFKEVDSGELLIQMCGNLIANIFGALIVCTVIDHVLQFNYKKIVAALILSKKEVYNVFLRIAFFACTINAVNYEINSTLQKTNIINSIYLAIITYYGMLTFYSFALRIVDTEPLHHTTKEIYPFGVLVMGVLFLIVCNVFSLFFHVGKHEPILLLFNSTTAILVAIGILILISRRTENSSNSYPAKRLFVFCAIIVGNCILSFLKWDGKGDILSQIVSGGVIFIVALIFLLYVNRKQNRGEWKYYLIINNDVDDLTKELILKELLSYDNDLITKGFNSPEELNEWVSKNDIFSSRNVDYYIEGHYVDSKTDYKKD